MVELGATDLDYLRRRQVKERDLQAKRRDGPDVIVRGAELDQGRLGNGGRGVLDDGVKSRVQSGEDVDLVRYRDKDLEGRGSPEESGYGPGEVPGKADGMYRVESLDQADDDG